MGTIFVKAKPKSRVTEQDKAVLQLKQQRDKLRHYQKRLNANLEKEREIAQQLLRDGKRDRAKLLLKKKRYQENLLTQTDAQMDRLEQLTHDIEFAQVEMKVLDGLKGGNEALKKLHGLLALQDIEQIMDEAREGIEKQQEIDELLSGALSEDDNEAVLAELESIVKETLPDVTEVEEDLMLPDVPQEKPTGAKAEQQHAGKVAMMAS